MFVVLEKFRCNLTIKIESRKAYDGAIYHDIDAREKWEKMERESKIGKNNRRKTQGRKRQITQSKPQPLLLPGGKSN